MSVHSKIFRFFVSNDLKFLIRNFKSSMRQSAHFGFSDTGWRLQIYFIPRIWKWEPCRCKYHWNYDFTVERKFRINQDRVDAKFKINVSFFKPSAFYQLESKNMKTIILWLQKVLKSVKFWILWNQIKFKLKEKDPS